jgi:hypothetical protein
MLNTVKPCFGFTSMSALLINMDKINLDELIKQAEDLGFEKCILALMQMNELKYYSNGIELAEALKEMKMQILGE